MLLWEHVIVGYLIYSVVSHLRHQRSPNTPETVGVIVGSMLPDLIDKPLAWKYGIFETGYALGHSIFLTSTLTIIVAELVRTQGWARVWFAFSLGWLLHVPLDILHYTALGRAPPFKLALWPVRIADGYTFSSGIVEPSLHLMREYLEQFHLSGQSQYMQSRIGIAAFGCLCWLYDTTPFLRKCIFTSKRVIADL